MTRHSVSQHLRLDVEAYDTAIRTFIPHYEELLSTGVEILSALIPADARIIDLGGGTGALSAAILERLPRANLELRDIDPAMLEKARARLAGHAGAGRLTLRRGSFYDPLPEVEAVVASLALHHIPEFDRKAEVYRGICRALKPDGVFLNLDAVVSSDPAIAEQTYAAWTRSMKEHGIDEEAARGHLAAWAKEDRYFSVHEELAALASAGFRRPECFYRRGPVAVLCARKS